VHRVGETAENQRKTREKTKVAENQVFWLDFCAKKRTVHYLSGVSQCVGCQDVIRMLILVNAVSGCSLFRTLKIAAEYYVRFFANLFDVMMPTAKIFGLLDFLNA
jgi:hypothetical protein